MKLESLVYLLGSWSMRENNLEADKKGSFFILNKFKCLVE